MRPILIALFLATTLTACTAPTAPVPAEAQNHWATPIKQDANLYRIDDKLYRSEQPITDDAASLHALGIKSVVNLRYFGRNKDRIHLNGQGFKLINQPLRSWHITPKHIAETLYTIEKQQKNGAVLLHCYHGADRTGLISGMYRIVYQNWSIEAAKNEMIQGPYGYHSIWKNIAALFTEEKVAEVKTHLQALHHQEKAAAE